MDEYASRVEQEDLQYTVTAPVAYDAIWTLAFALNTSINAVSEVPSTVPSIYKLSGRYSESA